MRGENFGNLHQTSLVELPKDFILWAKDRLRAVYKEDYETHDLGFAMQSNAETLAELLSCPYLQAFALSLLPSFLALAKALRKTPHPSEDIPEPDPHEYLNAIDSLSLSIFGREGGVALSLRLGVANFDVSQKQIAFFSVVSSYISEALDKLGEDRTDIDRYQFLIAPDYRSGINVRPVAWGDEECVAVIYLGQHCFENPFRTICLLCHEIAHYAGERYRKERAWNIFYMLGAFWLFQTSLGSGISDMEKLEHAIEGKSLLGRMAKTFADYLDELFVLHTPDGASDTNSHPSYHLAQLMRFLESHLYGASYLKDKEDRKRLIKKWVKGLIDAEGENSDEIKEALSGIQSGLESMYDGDSDGKAYACESLASHIAMQIGDLIDRGDVLQLAIYFQYFETVIFAYTEAYADMRMCELIGDAEFVDRYEELLGLGGEISMEDENGFRKWIRHDAVLYMFSEEFKEKKQLLIKSPIPASDPADWRVYCLEYLAARKIADYLKICHKRQAASERLHEILDVLKDGSSHREDFFIPKVIEDYARDIMTKQD